MVCDIIWCANQRACVSRLQLYNTQYSKIPLVHMGKAYRFYKILLFIYHILTKLNRGTWIRLVYTSNLYYSKSMLKEYEPKRVGNCRLHGMYLKQLVRTTLIGTLCVKACVVSGKCDLLVDYFSSTALLSVVGPTYYLFIATISDFLQAEFLAKWVTSCQAASRKRALLVQENRERRIIVRF